MSAPHTFELTENVPAVVAAADKTTNIGRCPHAGTVTAVSYSADAAVTGAATETRTISVVNKGQAGAGTALVASLALLSTVNLVASDEKTLILSGTAANLIVAEGDVLAFASVHSGTTGLADPGGLVRVQIARGDVSA